MKILIKLIVICLLVSSCQDTESITYDPNGNRTGIGFGVSVLDFSVPQGGTTVSIPVLATNTSSEARTFDVTVDTEASSEELSSADYSLGSATIPAGSYEGSVDVTINYDGLEDFVKYKLVLNLEAPNSAFPPVSLTFLKEYDITTFVCADLILTLVEDGFADERNWEITNSSGIVVQCSDFASCPSGAPSGSFDPATYNYTIPTLSAGDYTLTIYDAYGDGMFDGSIEGSYNLYCAAQDVVTYASGGGNFGESDSTNFTIVE
ncbi:MAG: hypothetical protein ABIO60_13970 [Aquaticitalea sp.]